MRLNIIKKSPAEIEAMKEAGRLSAYVLRKVGRRRQSQACRRSNSMNWLKRSFVPKAESRLQGLWRLSGSICASVNDQIVHGIPSSKAILREGDILSIDTGATVDGWVGDNAWTYPIGKVSSDVAMLLETTEKCMWAGLSAARAGNHLGDIGHAVQSIAEAQGYGVVRDYVGHGIGRHMHEDPNVPNYGRPHSGIELEVGMVLAIEPMVNMGTRKTRVGRDGWLVTTRDHKPSAHFEKTVAITEDGPLVLTTEPGFTRPVSKTC